jgi:hypothetical protein
MEPPTVNATTTNPTPMRTMRSPPTHENVRIFAQWLGQEKGDKENRVGQMQLLPVAPGTEICLSTIFA